MLKENVAKKAFLELSPYILIFGVAGAIAYTGYRVIKKASDAIDEIDWDHVFKDVYH